MENVLNKHAVKIPELECTFLSSWVVFHVGAIGEFSHTNREPSLEGFQLTLSH